MKKKKQENEYLKPRTLVFTVDFAAVICASPNERYEIEEPIDGDGLFN